MSDQINAYKPGATPDFSQLEVRRVDYETTKKLCLERHYSHKWNTAFGKANYGVYKDGRLLGVASYGYPMNPKSWPSLTTIPPEQCLELNRLWIDDELGANTETWLLGKSFRMLKEDGFRLIQSFADGRLGVGTIYQAANFSYHGYHDTLFHRHGETGVVYHDVTFNNTENVAPMLLRNEFFVQGQLTTFNVRTFRYLYPLDRHARKTIIPAAQPYPKLRTGEMTVPDYRPPVGQMARCYVLAEITDDPRKRAFREYLATNYPGEYEAHITAQRENTVTKRLAAEALLAPALWTFDDIEA